VNNRSLTGGVVLRAVVEDRFLQSEVRHSKTDVDVDWRLKPREVERIHRVPDCDKHYVIMSIRCCWCDLTWDKGTSLTTTTWYTFIWIWQRFHVVVQKYGGEFRFKRETCPICTCNLHYIILSHETASSWSSNKDGRQKKIYPHQWEGSRLEWQCHSSENFEFRLKWHVCGILRTF